MAVILSNTECIRRIHIFLQKYHPVLEKYFLFRETPETKGGGIYVNTSQHDMIVTLEKILLELKYREPYWQAGYCGLIYSLHLEKPLYFPQLNLLLL